MTSYEAPKARRPQTQLLALFSTRQETRDLMSSPEHLSLSSFVEQE